MKHLFFSISIFLLAIISSCSGDLSVNLDRSKDPNLRLWESHATEVYKIDQSTYSPFTSHPDYNQHYNQDYFINVTVVKGEVEMVIDTNLSFGESSIYTPFYITYSVEDLFEIINSAKSGDSTSPKILDVTYDAVYGYPTYLLVDHFPSFAAVEFEVRTKLIKLNAEKPFSYDQRKKWESLAISDFKIKQELYCPPCIIFHRTVGLVTIKDNQIESAISLPDSTEVPQHVARARFYSIADLFYTIDQAFVLISVGELKVHYDADKYFPDTISTFSLVVETKII